MSDTPLVTIGLLVYDSKQYVQQSLDSLLVQAYPDFVVIISDNASTAGTNEVCQRYASMDWRVRDYRNEVSIGNPRNVNRVAELTTRPIPYRPSSRSK